MLADAEKRAAYDRFGHAGVSSPRIGRLRPDDLRRLRRHPRRARRPVRLRRDVRRAASPRRAATRCRPALRPRDRLRGGATAAPRPSSRCRGRRRASACEGSGSAKGTAPATCPRCHGRGQLRYQQGFFTVAQTCGQCGGAGRVITSPCAECRGAGHVPARTAHHRQDPAGIATGQRLRLQREGEAGLAGGPPGDLVRGGPRRGSPALPARRRRPASARSPSTFPVLALGGTVEIPTVDGPHPTRDPRGHPGRDGVSPAGPGHAEHRRPGQRRPARRRVRVRSRDKLTREQRTLLEKLACRCPQRSQPAGARRTDQDERGVFDRVKDLFS